MNEIKLNLEQGKSHWYAVIEVEKLLNLYQKHCIRRQPHHLSHIIMLSGYEIQNNILEFKATADSWVLKKKTATCLAVFSLFALRTIEIFQGLHKQFF